MLKSRLMRKDIEKLIDDIQSMDSDDDSLQLLLEASQYYCSNHDLCEGAKHSLVLTLHDQYTHHEDEQGSDELQELKKILGLWKQSHKKSIQ